MLSGLILGAGGHGDGSINWIEIVAMTINFGILVYLVPKVVKALGPDGLAPKALLKKNRDDLAAKLKEAEVKQAEAEARLTEYAKKLDNLEAEVATIVETYKKQGEADKQRITEDADKAVERLVREADFTIRQESLKAQREIRGAAVETTVKMAEDLVKQRITDADRRRLADEYIGSVEQNGAN